MMKIIINSLTKYIVLSIFFVFGIIGCSSNGNSNYSTNPPVNNGGGGPGTNEIWLQNIAFSPNTLTISAGTTVKWTNKDGITHTVTSGLPGAPDAIFDSGNLGNGSTFSYTFNTKGTFKYYCKIHGAMMTGSVTVQ